MLYFKAPGGELVPYTGVLTFYIKAHPGEKGVDGVVIVCGSSVVARFDALSAYGISRHEAERFIRLLETTACDRIERGNDCGIIDVREAVFDEFEELSSYRERYTPTN